ncbi:hypothetical protein [Oleiharenicola lentus]|uniref:hypothetical protein n=1 Tax=Oleiharenicola lentus TaxID=2508720 RepID=UPI003F67F58A
MIRSLLTVLLASLLLASSHAAQRDCEVNVNVDMTVAGRKIAPPTKEKPIHYYPVVGSFKSATRGDPLPDQRKTLRAFAVALARQNYLVMSQQVPPTVVLVFRWGAVDPEIEEFEIPGEASPLEVFSNQNEMFTLVGGNQVDPLSIPMVQEAVNDDSRDSRYFIVVTAYDYASFAQKKKVPLWRARMSTHSEGVMMDDVAAALITSGAPHFGVETKKPVRTLVSLERKGRVDLGELEVKAYLDQSVPNSKKP